MKLLLLVILLVIAVFVVVLMYSLCVVSHNADEQAEKMYSEWKRTHK